jgi:acyl-CoA thioesterase FadM
MSFLLRFLKIALLALFGGRRGLLEPSVITLRVWPNDLDMNVHMNNGRYLSLMDLGRLDVMFHNGAFGLWVKRGWQPLVAWSSCRHFKALRVFQRFEIHTRVLGWDEKWVYFEQRFTRGDALYALAGVKALMAGPQGPVPTAELFAATGAGAPPSPALPDWFQTWLQAERQAIDWLKKEKG